MSQWASISDIAEDVQAGEQHAVALVKKALKTIETKKQFDAIISTTDKRALERAHDIDARVRQGEKIGRLAGVPFIVKDNFLTYDSETSAASNILKGFTAPYQATAIKRLEAEGAIVVAKANLDAFGHGASTENSDLMTTKNPHDNTRVPGGSSGGSAAAVVLDMVPFALGTDTGGSSRQPASFSGTIGYKPTYGLISRSGIVAMASSTDTVGTLARTVEDLSLILDIMAGRDELDSTTIDSDTRGYTDLNGDIKDVRIGLIKEHMTEGVDAGVKQRVQQVAKTLEDAGAVIVDVSLPSLSLALACYYIIMPAEVSSNLSRYDGQRYGYSTVKGKSLDDSYNWSRSEGFGREAKRRIMIGTYVLSSGYYDAYYKKAQQLRTKLINEFNDVFKDVDFLIGPVAPTTAFKIGENSQDPLQMYLSDVMTVAASLVGVPAVSVPAGKVENLPVGVQLMAPQKYDRQLLGLAKKLEDLQV